MSIFSLDGKVALITGASRGIGRAIAETLSEYGAEVVLVSRKIEDLEEAAGQIVAKGGKAGALACHMGDAGAIGKMCEQLEQTYGRLDILVNNAAANPYFGPMEGADEAAWEKTMGVTLKGPFFLIRGVIPLMKNAGGGAIVNVSSVNGLRPGFLQGIYSISKGALITMTQAFAKELAPYRIRVNALVPGLTDTHFASALIKNKQIYNTIVTQIPLGRHAEPREMAGAVLFMVSEASSYMTGSCLTCDGGIMA
jgi:NAD(P)-dependent dehydrogenase (short-subunit alcohol dehydrogenase family)